MAEKDKDKAKDKKGKGGPLAGQTAIVTGGSSGIGAGICRAYAKAGAAVGVADIVLDRANKLVKEIEADGGLAMALKADVSKEAQVGAMFERFVKRFHRIDILVANAGIQRDAPVEKMTLEQWNEVLGANAAGQFLCAREAIRRFVAQKPPADSRAIGKIICMSSVHQFIPWAGHVNYAASKGAVHLLMESLAQEVAGRKIRVNAIAPGAIRTPINTGAWSTPQAMKELLRLIPYGRIGEPDDVAKLAVWLASDDSDYVVGATIVIDGGMSLYPGFVGNG